MMDFFCFLIWSFFFYFIAFGLSPSGLGYEGFFLFFDFGLLFPYYCLWFKTVELRLWRIFFVFWFGASFAILLPLVWARRVKAMKDFFCLLIRGFFFHFIAFGLSPSGLGYDGFFCFLIWSFFFHFIAFGVSLSGLGYNWFFLFFDLGLLFPFHCLWIKSVGFRLWWIFFVFLIWRFFFHFIAFGSSPSGLGYDGFFFLFFDLGLLFPFYCLWFNSVGFRLWWIFFVFWFGASFSILLPLV